jgi:hypothetical protein
VLEDRAGRSERKIVLFARIVILLGVLIGVATPAQADRRIALVVGNDAYESISRLERAVIDATAVAQSLRAIGFEVMLATDVSRRELVRQLAEFNSRAQSSDLALFYYAGHGIEIRGANYILPIDVPPVKDGQETLLTSEALPTEKIVSDLQDRGARAVVLILDACRDNPFKRPGTRSVGGVRGLARSEPPEGVFVLYSAGVGQTALDRLSSADRDPNSVFTRVFLKEIERRDATMIEVAKATQVQVRSIALQVEHLQVPAYYDQIIGQLQLAPGAGEKIAAKPPTVAAPRPQPEPGKPTAAPDQPQPHGRISNAVLTNKGFEDYLARTARTMSVRDTFMPKAPESCDQLASAGSDDPDSRAPRVPLDKLDIPRATRACVAAILQEPGTPRLRAQLARVLLRAPVRADKIDGLAILNDLARDGSAVAMWKIAIAYATGSVVKKDMARAVSWYRSAAEKGLGAAMSDLGYYYAEGDGIPKNPAEAARWFEQAAAVGHPGGMRNFAFMLDRGAGIAANPVRAADYLLTAYRLGSDSAKESLFNLHESWQPETKKEVQRLLREYGYYNGPLQGTFDNATFAALRALAAANPVPQRD